MSNSCDQLVGPAIGKRRNSLCRGRAVHAPLPPNGTTMMRHWVAFRLVPTVTGPSSRLSNVPNGGLGSFPGPSRRQCRKAKIIGVRAGRWAMNEISNSPPFHQSVSSSMTTKGNTSKLSTVLIMPWLPQIHTHAPSRPDGIPVGHCSAFVRPLLPPSSSPGPQSTWLFWCFFSFPLRTVRTAHLRATNGWGGISLQSPSFWCLLLLNGRPIVGLAETPCKPPRSPASGSVPQAKVLSSPRWWSIRSCIQAKQGRKCRRYGCRTISSQPVRPHEISWRPGLGFRLGHPKMMA